MFNRTTRKKVRRVLNQLHLLREAAMPKRKGGGMTDYHRELKKLKGRLERLNARIEEAEDFGSDDDLETADLEYEAKQLGDKIKKLQARIKVLNSTPGGISMMTNSNLRKEKFLKRRDFSEDDDELSEDDYVPEDEDFSGDISRGYLGDEDFLRDNNFFEDDEY